MTRRPLGRSGIEIAPIGFGAFKIGRNEGIKYPRGYALPDDDGVRALLDGVLSLGIDLIDTAPAYGTSERRLGAALAGRRDDVIISTKVGERFRDGASTYAFDGASIERSVTESLQRLRTDHVDLLLIHSDGNDLQIQRETDAVPTLQRLRDRGLTRAIGLSGKTLGGHREALAWADGVMIEYNARERGQEPLLAEAAAAGVGVLVKKALASGHLPAEEALPFVLDRAEVTSVVIGSLSVDHLAAAVRLATG
jgi:aryl-alcohol dehydrogenase-like predicted oxidoreductase